MRLAPLFTMLRKNLGVVGLAGYLLVAIGGSALFGIDATGPYVFGYVAALWIVVGAVRVWGRLRLRRAIRLLRRLDAAGREAALRGVYPKQVREQVADLLAEEGAPESDGFVERFRFSPTDRRWNRVYYWLGFFLATALLALGILVLPHRSASAVVAIGSAVIVAPCLWWLRQRERRFANVLEISRFGLTEVDAGGTVRRVVWGQTLVLRNRTRLQRVELTSVNGDPGIRVPYDLVGFNRALDLIIEYGGFVFSADEPPGAGDGGAA